MSIPYFGIIQNMKHSKLTNSTFLKNTDVLILDVDGTLIDTISFIESTYFQVLKEQNIRITKKRFREFVTLPAIEVFANLAPNHDGKVLMDQLSKNQLSILHTVLAIPGALDSLTKFKKKGGMIATVTSRTKHTGIELLKQTNLYDLIDYKIFRDDITHPKPHPESLTKTLKYFGKQKDSAVMVGDSIVDIEAGKNAGVKTIGVLTGFDKKILKESNPDLLIKDISLLHQYI